MFANERGFVIILWISVSRAFQCSLEGRVDNTPRVTMGVGLGEESTSFKAHSLSSINASITIPHLPLPSSCSMLTVTGFEGGKIILSGRVYILFFFFFVVTFSSSHRRDRRVGRGLFDKEKILRQREEIQVASRSLKAAWR